MRVYSLPFDNESDFTRQTCALLEAAGAYVIALVGTGTQVPGLPDRIVTHCRLGGALFLEMKRNDAWLDPAQWRCLEALRLRRAAALVVRVERGDTRIRAYEPARRVEDARCYCETPVAAIVAAVDQQSAGRILLWTLSEALRQQV